MQKEEPIFEIANEILKWVVHSIFIIGDYLGPGSSSKQILPIRLEAAYFFLFMMDKYALEIGGTQYRDVLNSDNKRIVIHEVVDLTINRAYDTKELRSQEWIDGMTNVYLGQCDEAINEYQHYEKLKDDTRDLLGDRTILGRLSARMAKGIEQPNSNTFADLIERTITECLSKSELKAKVETTYQIMVSDARSSELVDELLATALGASSAIAHLSEKKVTFKITFDLVVEMLSFYLMMFDSFLFKSGIEKGRDELMDDIVLRSIASLVETPFYISASDKRLSNKKWLNNMNQNVLTHYNNTISDYVSCKTVTDDKLDLSGRTVLGLLSIKVAKLFRKNSDPLFLSSVGLIAMKGISVLHLKKRAEAFTS